MPTDNTLVVDYAQPTATAPILPCPPVLTSHQTMWQNIQLAHYELPPWEIPEIASPQHTIVLTMPKQTTRTEVVADGRLLELCQYKNTQLRSISVLPADLPIKVSWNRDVEFTHCYLESKFFAQVAHESVDPDRVELLLTVQKPDPLIWQIGLALKSVLATNPNHSCFYAESMATALAAHLLEHYSTRKQILREYPGGLPPYRLNQAIEYINAHLGENISLLEIAAQVDMSQYYFCRLFKESVGMTPHRYSTHGYYEVQ